ncbi:MAG: hypothetical protein WD669_01885 [Pirellulales bacterium]
MRKYYVARTAAAAIACVWLIGTATGGDVPREIASQYRPAVEKLKQAYTHATVEGTASVAYPTKDKSRTQEFVMRAAGKYRRLDLKTTGQKGMGLRVGSTQMRIAAPQGSLLTTMDSGSKFFDDATETGYADTVSQIDNRSLLHFPYALDSSGTILDMLLNPSVKVTSVKKIKGEGKTVVQINYEETSRHEGHTGLWKSQLVLSPSDGWALLGFSRTLDGGSNPVTQRAKLTYSGFEDGVPLVESIQFESSEGGKSIRKESIDITEFKLGDPDDYYFTSFAF